MSAEQPSPEANDQDYYVTGIEMLPSFNLNPIKGMKRWLEKRRGNPRRLEGPYAAMLPEATNLHQSKVGNPDRFYDGFNDNFEPEPLGIFAGEGAASALDFARQLDDKQVTDKVDD